MKKISTKSIVALVLLAVAIAFSLWYFNAPAGQGSLRRLGAPKGNASSATRVRECLQRCNRAYPGERNEDDKAECQVGCYVGK